MRPITSASNLFRRALCPGSARLEAGLSEEETEQSHEGEMLHHYSAHPEYNRAVLKPHQKDLLELADTLQKKVIDTVEFEIGAGYEKLNYIEQAMLLDGHEFGTPDFTRYYLLNKTTEVALVIDRKFGFNVVERAELNLQLRTYAVLAYDFLAEATFPKQVFVAIVQPRAPYEERITIARYTPADIEAATEQIYGILKESKRADAPLVAGEEQCRYCKAKLTCPAFREAMLVPAVITPDKALSKAAREAYLEQRIAELSDDQLEKVIIAIRLAGMVNDIALDEARKRIAAGGMTNLTVAKASEVREVVDVRKAMAILSLSGLEKSDIFDCVTKLSLTNLGNILRMRHPDWTWKQVNEWVNFKLQSVIEIETRKGRVMSK